LLATQEANVDTLSRRSFFFGLPLLNVPSIPKETSPRLRFRKPVDLATIREKNMRHMEKMRAEGIARLEKEINAEWT
jgi:hypothetical protein